LENELSLISLMTPNAKFYSPSQQLPLDEVIVFFQQTVIFKQYIPRKHKHFCIKVYKLRDMSCTYDMNVFLEKDR